MQKASKYIWIGLLIPIVLFFWSGYNGLVTANEEVEAQWGNVQTEYQARMDKVNVISKIVKNVANFEQQTLTDVVKARANATKTQVQVDDLTPETLSKFEAAQSQFSSALSRLLVTVERYPDLKAAAAFRDFQVQYEGIENRIAKARRDFNKIAKSYNLKVKKVPGNILASLFGFDVKPYFESNSGAENAPTNLDLGFD